MGSFRWWISLSIFFLIIPTQSGCIFSKKVRVANTALMVEDVATSAYKQSDLRVIREGMPAYLMLMDGMVEAWPDNERILIATAQAYSSFASVFVEDQDKEYAQVLYDKAKKYALQSLVERGFKDPTTSTFDEFTKDVEDADKKDLPYVFWSAACWASWIIINIDSIEAVAELPRVELMMRRALELDEGFYYGGPHIFMGMWFASRPAVAGGSLDKAKGHFKRALELGEGKFLMTYVYYADQYARRALDKDLFIATLNKVQETPSDIVPELTLMNTVAKQKAEELLNRVDEYFE